MCIGGVSVLTNAYSRYKIFYSIEQWIGYVCMLLVSICFACMSDGYCLFGWFIFIVYVWIFSHMVYTIRIFVPSLMLLSYSSSKRYRRKKKSLKEEKKTFSADTRVDPDCYQMKRKKILAQKETLLKSQKDVKLFCFPEKFKLTEMLIYSRFIYLNQ